jgi:two-component system NtrC family sensor kinase
MDEGALGVLGVASALERDERRALLEAGAADVVSPRCDAWELARRLERVARVGRLAHRVEEGVLEIESQRALFQGVIDTIPFSLYAIDREYRVVVWNRGREAGPFGRPRQSVLGESIFGAVGEQVQLRQEFAEVFESGLPQTTEVAGSAGGPPRIFRVEKIPMRLGSGGEITHVINFARDVTDQRRMERTMAQAEKLAAVGRLAAGIAHEINNPLATIAGTAEALRYALADGVVGSESDELAQDTRVIEEEAYRCKEILQSLLDFSRSPSEERERVDLAWVAKRTVRLLRHNPKLARATLRVEIEEQEAAVLGNENALIEALMALILNAADASPEGNIVVRAGLDAEGHPLLGVSDDGPGIPAGIRERICEPFFTTKPPGQGTGLGLSVVYGLVQAHEGELDIQSSPETGSRFTMVFPECRESIDREEIGV